MILFLKNLIDKLISVLDLLKVGIKTILSQLVHCFLYLKISQVLGTISHERMRRNFLVLSDLLPEHLLVIFVESCQLLRVVLLTIIIAMAVHLEDVDGIIIGNRLSYFLVLLDIIGVRHVLQSDLAEK